jgi:hypothetical protein
VIVFITSLVAAALEPAEGPESLLIPYENSSEIDELLRDADDAMMADYMQRADSVLVGQIVAVRGDPSVLGQQEIATLLVKERLRGSAVGLVEFTVPLQRHAGRIQPSLIEGYEMLIFLDNSGQLLDGEGLFFLEGGFAWRNRTNRVFLRPSIDRIWSDSIDPTEDYVTFPLAILRGQVSETSRRRWWASSR